VDARVFISNNQKGEETKTAERQRERERERECVRDSLYLEVKVSVSHKMDHWRKTFGDRHVN
jgi:hypothetical protein